MKTFFTNYLSLILLGILIIISIVTLFKIPDNLKEAIDNISKAESKIDASLNILGAQKDRMDSLIKINEELLLELDKIKNSNSEITTFYFYSFS
jgi:hypothetical protein